MFYLACTRFNDLTYYENITYRIKNNEKTIYGTTLKIRNIYPYGSFIFVAEMNNENNIIEGIGLIKNLLVCDKRHKIYENDEYNRYIYRGRYWVNKEKISEFDGEILEIFNNILFKRKSHLKRRIGIIVITEQLLSHWVDFDYTLINLKNKVKNMFLHYFKKGFIKYLELDIPEQKSDDKVEEQKTDDKVNEEFIIIPKKRKRLHKVKNIEI